MNMIERVARALCDASGDIWREPPFNTLHTDALNNHWRIKARAAIEAMREPTDAMDQAGYESQLPDAWPDDTGDIVSELICARLAWDSMINAALTA